MNYYPRQAVWEMSLKCNMNCMHCGSRAGKPRENELSLEECLDIAQQLIDMKLELITLIGGEIFLKDGWEQVARKFVDNGVYTNIITNAYNLSDKHYDQLKRSGINQVAISIDGMEEVHNTIRRNSHSFEHVLKALDRLREEGYYTEAITTLTDLNFSNLEDMYNLFVNKGVEIWQIQLASPMGNASENLKLLLEPKKVPLITKFIRDKNKEGKILVVAGDSLGYYDENEHYIRGVDSNTKPEFYGCQAGKFVVGIDSIGNVKGCESLQSDDFIEGNLRERSLYDIWNDENAFAYNRKMTPSMLAGKCASCDRAEICAGGCRQLSNFTSGNKYESVYCCYNI